MPDMSLNDEYYNRACKVTCGGYQTASKSPLRFPQEHPIYVVEGKGCKLKDINGNWYTDFVSGLGTSILGYGYPRIVDTAIKQIKKGTLFSLEHINQISLSELLYKTIPSAEKCKYFRNGSDATAAAIKVSRVYTGKDSVLMFEGNYHGNADVFTLHQDIHDGVPSINKQVSYCIKPDIESVKMFVESHNDIACIITEPVVYEHRKEFLRYLRDICNEKGIILIFDEIITHLRCNIGGIQKEYKIIPDLTTISKGMSCGYPISALVGKDEIMSCFDIDKSILKCFYSGSFHGDALSIAIAEACVYECINKKVPVHIYNNGLRLKKEFNKLCSEKNIPMEMYGLPYRMILKYNPICNIEPNDIKSYYLQETAHNYLIFGNIIYCNLSHTNSVIDKTIDICDEILDNMALSIEQNTIRESIIGRKCMDLNLRK